MEKILLHNRFSDIIEKEFKSTLIRVEDIPQSGSARKYFRLFFRNADLLTKTVIACVSDNTKENKTFIALAETFRQSGLPVPEMLFVSEDYRLYVQSDVGHKCLLDILKHKKKEKSRYKEELEALVCRSIENLCKFQGLDENKWKDRIEFPPLGSDLIFYDFNYCINNFIIPSEVSYNDFLLQKELSKLSERLLAYPKPLWGFMYRDFQSRNIMLDDKEKQLHFIDFQSGRKGPGIYDIVSFLWQAKADFSNEERERYLSVYANLKEEQLPGAAEIILDNVSYWCCFRLMQVLGAYGLRGLKEGKKHFIESIPQALDNFADVLENTNLFTEFPTLSEIILTLHERKNHGK